MKDYNVKIAGENQTPKSYEYEEEIKDMRILMRSKKYLCDPSKKSTLKNINGEEMDKTLLDIVELAKSQKKENCFQVIKHQDFNCGFKNKKLDIFSKNTVKVSYEEHIRILIGSIDDDTMKYMLYEYWQDCKKLATYSAESFVDELLAGNFNFNFEDNNI